MAAPAQFVFLVVAANEDGRLEVFAPSTDRSLWFNRQWQPGNSWRGWRSMGSPRSDDGVSIPAAALNDDGRMEVVIESGGIYYHASQTAPGGSWTGWRSLGSPNLEGGIPALGTNQDGRLELFMSDGHEIWHSWQLAANGDAWSGWESLGHLVTAFPARGAPTVEINADGRLEVFVTSTDTGVVHHRWQESPGGAWVPWTIVGTLNTQQPFGDVQSVAVAVNDDGRLEAFGVAASTEHIGTLWHSSQRSAGQEWGDWERIGEVGGLSTDGDLVAVKNKDGRLEVFGIAVTCFLLDDCSIVHQAQTSPGGGWGTPQNLSGSDFTFRFTVGQNLDGRLEVFTNSADGVVQHAWQLAPGQGWSGFVPLLADPDPGGDSPPTVDAGPDTSGDEGSPITLSGSVHDAEGPPAVQWGYAPSGPVDPGTACSFGAADHAVTTFTCNDDGEFTLTLTADDGVNLPVEDTVEVEVRNVAPRMRGDTAGLVASTGLSPQPWSVYRAGHPVPMTAPYDDPGSNDTQVCRVDWDNRAPAESYPGVAYACDRSHVYPEAGMYTVALTITDDDNDAGGESTLVVVYDPDAGFATGGGYLATPDGKAHFTFNPHYAPADEGPAPTLGKVRLHVDGNGPVFESTSLDWLVVTDGAMAARGRGTVNDAGDFGFVIYAYQTGQLRLVIWDPAVRPHPSDISVYDNHPSTEFDVDRTGRESIAAGSIQIHR